MGTTDILTTLKILARNTDHHNKQARTILEEAIRKIEDFKEDKMLNRYRKNEVRITEIPMH